MRRFQIGDEFYIKVDRFLIDTVLVRIMGIDNYDWVFSVIETKYNRFFVNEILKYNPNSNEVIGRNDSKYDVLEIITVNK